MSYSVVFQLDQESQAAANALIGQTRNVIKDLPDIRVEWVIHGKAVHFLRSDAFLKSNEINEVNTLIQSDFSTLVEQHNVKILVCKNALVSQRIDDRHLLKQAEIIPSGVGHIIKRQAEGWSYIKVAR